MIFQNLRTTLTGELSMPTMNALAQHLPHVLIKTLQKSS
jgi:hypothetical protein